MITIGAINWDINIWVDNFPVVGEEVTVRQVTRVPGGKAANTAVAAARVSHRNRVAVFGAVGTDDIGRGQVETLAEEGIDVSHIKVVRGIESGQAYITIDRNGSNFIETLFGANHHLLPEDLVRPENLATISDCKVIAISDPLVSTAERISALGTEHDATILYDAGTKLQAGAEKLKTVLRNVSILVLNSVESQQFAGSDDPSEVRRKLKNHDLDMGVIVKLGEKGCAYAGRDGETLRLPALPLEKLGLKVVNTTGCGDAFLGVLSASMAQGFSVAQSLERATIAGGLKASKAETRCSPDKQALDKALESWRDTS
ncbi:MAG: PfkB family carbohydrate kinase [Promethearchaeati archaeon SRVP18_Atabeyarchaeia-1]